ncbi:hypothetical protein, partial [Latilactobacillus curvatus]|uniref:hypothetical protein n=1 Tax=Latilactobacillus curvatus TaxID=28038 RepID=UPI0021A3DAA1
SLNSFEYLIAIIKSSFMMYYIEQFVRNSIIGADVQKESVLPKLNFTQFNILTNSAFVAHPKLKNGSIISDQH